MEAKKLAFPVSSYDSSASVWWFLLAVVTAAALISRLHNIATPAHVCWDETHFGKMGSWYINQTFFFDVHPPLGKMLVGAFGIMTGYNGSFPFKKPGDKYGDTPYVGMRVCCAMMGVALIPMVYIITWKLTRKTNAAVFSAVLLICDTGTLTLTRYILLDAPLLFFIMAATLCMLQFQSLRQRSFSAPWWFWMILTGSCLACATSVKFVGVFVVLLAGMCTVQDLWCIMGDLTLSMKQFAQHFLARAFCLIVVPALIYILLFKIHLSVLINSGSGDGFFSSAFQSSLKGNPLHNTSMPANLAYGSIVTMKNRRTGGGYLHSHWHLYPEGFGARQQQVTTYSHKDSNNEWLVKRYDREPVPDEPVELVRDGDLLRLQHVTTSRNLHSHKESAPITQRHFQVTCYGEQGSGDANDVFRLEVVRGSRIGALLETVRSQFRLVHLNMGCAVHSHNKQLPKWGWEQLEVTCNPRLQDDKNLWNVEEVQDQRLPNTSFEVYGLSFLEKFVESHAVMFQGNSGLKPKAGEVTSRPWQWPINLRGQPFSGNGHRVYLLGNPVIWWGNLVAIATFVVLFVHNSTKKHRIKEGNEGYIDVMLRGCAWLFGGWLLHYLPFWTMSRVLYFHHYFPAHLFATMISGIILEYSIEEISSWFSSHRSAVKHTLLGVSLAVITYSFYVFSPLSYGMSGPLADNQLSPMAGLKWLSTWEI